MRSTTIHRFAPALLLPLVGCILGTKQLGDPEDESSSSTAVTTASTTATTSSGGDGMTGPQEGTTSPPGEGTSTTSNGSDPSDGSSSTGCDDMPCPPEIVHCDVWAQDCPHQEKCTAYADEGEPAWDDTRCVPLADAPKHEGDPCTVQGWGTSGLDDCDIGLMCFHIDEDLQGECVSLCHGSPQQPMCDQGELCAITNDEVLTLCLRSCDPETPDCPEDQSCFPVDGGAVCYGDLPTPYGEDCTTNECDNGYTCVNAEVHAACAFDACCTLFCDPDAAACPEGSACVPDEGNPEVGRCLAPS